MHFLASLQYASFSAAVNFRILNVVYYRVVILTKKTDSTDTLTEKLSMNRTWHERSSEFVRANEKDQKCNQIITSQGKKQMKKGKGY